jgi:hypothetical protein
VNPGTAYDVFVAPLVAALQSHGMSVWYDRFAIRLGDDIRARIDEGLRSSRFGVVIVSPHSAKYWTPPSSAHCSRSKPATGRRGSFRSAAG